MVKVRSFGLMLRFCILFLGGVMNVLNYNLKCFIFWEVVFVF